MSTPTDRIVRHSASERVNHWLVAILFFLAASGGLALFHPYFFPLTALLGGGTWTRILHPFIGVLLFLAFAVLAARLAGDNRLTASDLQWLRQAGDVINKREDKLPEAGRYNAGQKSLFWVMSGTLFLLLVSGIIFWQPWFAPYFSVEAIRVAVVVHGVAAFILMAGLVVHVYAAFWIKGSIQGMTRGTVSRAWVRKFHPAWHRQITRGE